MTEGEYEIFIADMLWDEIMGTDNQKSEDNKTQKDATDNECKNHCNEIN